MVVRLYEPTESPEKQAWSRAFGQAQNAGKQACLLVPSREALVYTRTQKSAEMLTVTTLAIVLEMFCHYAVYSHLYEQDTKVRV